MRSRGIGRSNDAVSGQTLELEEVVEAEVEDESALAAIGERSMNVEVVDRRVETDAPQRRVDLARDRDPDVDARGDSGPDSSLRSPAGRELASSNMGPQA